MRISDWSSDVCSSDLERDAEQRIEDRKGRAAEEAHVAVGKAEIGLDIDREDADDLPVDEVEDIDDDEHRQDVPAVTGGFRLGGGGRTARVVFGHWQPSPSFIKIGRASCRERGCQYV